MQEETEFEAQKEKEPLWRDEEISEKDRKIERLTLWVCAITCAFFFFKIVFF